MLTHDMAVLVICEVLMFILCESENAKSRIKIKMAELDRSQQSLCVRLPTEVLNAIHNTTFTIDSPKCY